MNTLKVSISRGNKKMGAIPSISLPPVITCPNCETCKHKCYAVRLAKLRKTVRDAWMRNLNILKDNPDAYFLQVKAAAILTNFFRWHVSGDIPDADYLNRMCKVARDCKNTNFLAFTKNYDVVNDYLDNHKKPRNLQLIFSLPFDGAAIDNRHNLPVAVVIPKGHEPAPEYKVCGGDCSNCACRAIGCWELKKGETVAFSER